MTAADFQDYLDSQEAAVATTIKTLYGTLPQWLPEPVRGLIERALTPLYDAQQTDAQILRHVRRAGSDAPRSVPGTARDPAAFIQAVNCLAHVQWALSLPQAEAIQKLGGTDAVRGNKVRLDLVRAARAPRNVQRNQRIIAAAIGGKGPKQIAADEGLSISQVRRILVPGK